jgi:putative redox protein
VEPVITVEHKDGDHYAIRIRQHLVEVDQPADAGGSDTAPTPTELFVSSLASCVAFYAGRYLARHGLSADGLVVRASYEIVPRPARVGRVELSVSLPEGVPEEKRAALLAVASHCTVHNSLQDVPQVAIELVA